MPYKAVIIGCGPMGCANMDLNFPFKYSYAEAILGTPGVTLEGVVDTAPLVADNWSKRLNVKRYPTFNEAFDDKPDIVCIAGGTTANAEIIPYAIRSNVKAVWCEKPISLSLEYIKRLLSLEEIRCMPTHRKEEEPSTKIQVNYLRNLCSTHDKIATFIRNGGLGRLQTVRVNYCGGILANATHATAYLQKIFEVPIEATGVFAAISNIDKEGRPTKDDPNISGIIKYRTLNSSSGEQGEVDVFFTPSGRGKANNNLYLFEIEFLGDKGRLTLLHNTFDLRYEIVQDSHIFGASVGTRHPYETTEIPKELGTNGSTKVHFEPMLDGMQTLIEAIENNTPTRANVGIAYHAQLAAHMLALSAERHGKRVTLTESDLQIHVFAGTHAGISVLRKQTGADASK